MFGDRAGPTRELHELVEFVKERIDEALNRLTRMEGRIKKMPTRSDLDALKAELKQAIQDETAQVSADIQALRDQIARGEPITDVDLADLQDAIQRAHEVDPDAPTP